MPVAVLEGAATVVGSEVWYVGGIDADGVTLANSWRLDLDTERWSPGPDLPSPRDHLILVTVGDTLFAVGGAVLNDPGPPEAPQYRTHANVWALATEEAEWTERTSMPERRAAAGGAVIDGQVYVVGGFTGSILSSEDWLDWRGKLIETAHRFDPATSTWSPLQPIPTVRDHIGVAAVGGDLFALGGRRLLIGETSSAHERFRAARGSWDSDPIAVPDGRGGAGVAVLDDRIHVVGGEPRVHATRHNVYHPAEDRWLRAPPLPVPLHGAPAVTVMGKLYLFGGAGSEDSNDTRRTVWVFEPSS